MKTVTVNVQIQLDIPKGDVLEQTINALNLVNVTLSESGIYCEPQIFVNSIDKSDINE